MLHPLASGLVTTALVLGMAAASTPHRVPESTVLPMQDSPAEQKYRQLCAACHGSEGKGDGPAAAALNPAPTDFSTAEFQEGRSEEQIAQAITQGSGAMPGFRSQLNAEQIEALVAYVRHFGGHGSS